MKLKIISETSIILELEDVNSVSMPGTDGQMQILPSHTDLVSSLEVGDVKVESSAGTEEILINGGFVVVRKDDILIMAGEAEKLEEIKQAEIEQAIEKAQQQKTQAQDPKELIELEKKLRYEKFKRSKASI